MTNQRNVRNLILGKSLAINTSPGDGIQVEPSNLAEGQVVLTLTNGQRELTSLSAASEFCVVQGQGASKPLIKHNIKVANITSVSVKPYVAATEQVTFIGYTGSTGSLPAGGVDTTYYGATVLKGEFETYGAREMKKTFDFKCSTSDSTADVAAGLAQSIYNGVARMADPYYKVERVSNADTFTATTGTATHLKFSKGSKTVAFVTAAGVASTGTGVAVGNVINVPSSNSTTFTVVAPSSTSGIFTFTIGNTVYSFTMATNQATNAGLLVAAINAGTQATASGTSTVTITLLSTVKPSLVSAYNATTAAAVAVTTTVGNAVPVKYIVTSVDSSSAYFILDLPYTGESGIAVTGVTAASMASVATLSSGTLAWGLKLTALPKTYADITFRFYKIRFAVELFNMGSTVATEVTAASEGSGTSESVQWLESFLVGNEGARYTVQPDMPLIRRKNSLNYLGSAQGWNMITINYFDVNTTNISGGQKLEKSITIAGPTGGGASSQFKDTTNGFITILDTVPGITITDTWV